MINKLLKLSFVIVAVGLLFAPYGSAMPTDDDFSVLSRLGYFAPAPPEPELSSDGKTLYNGGLPVVYVADPTPSPEPLRVPAPIDLRTAPESATATFTIDYVPNGGTDLWGEACYTFPAAAQTAFSAAASIWANTIQSSVPITIRACWGNLGSSSILGYSGGGPLHRNFTGAPLTATWYSGSLANSLAGSDLDSGSYDMHITYNLNFTWYYGTDGNTPSGQHDLMTVVLHEIAHGLNFSGSMSYSGGSGSWGYGLTPTNPNIYDTFMRDGSGNQLINTGVYPNPSTALGTALTSNDIWFHGSNAMAANGGVRVKMYAPSTWSGGSSYSHLDYTTFNNTINELMVYAISSGESVHDPGPVTKGLFEDLGWQIVQPQAGGLYTMNPNATYSYEWGTSHVDNATWSPDADDGYIDLSLTGFDFQFYRTPVTSVRISTNGYITFGTDGTNYSNDPIPSAILPNAIIAPFWDDLNLSGLTTAQGVWLGMFGTAPNRRLVIEWFEVPTFGYGTETYSFEIILYESSDRIKFQYYDVDSGTAYDFGASATVGIENADGTDGLQFSYNTASLSNGKAIEFIPRLPGIVDFDGDGKTDLAIYRVSTGAWYVYPSSGAAPYGLGWGGNASDKPAPGDYDGDGKTDVSVYRVGTGAWYVIPSSGAAPYGMGWGGDASDKGVPGDYDGDGKADLAVYRTSTGAWYVYPSSGATPYGVGWGGDVSDKAAPGDYDGDGKTDLAVYRTSTGAWYVRPSSGAAPYGVGWGGNATDKPVPGDYDGDGKTDIAVYRTSTGAWYVSPSSGAAPYGFGWGGNASDKPAAGDYDGDGKADLAVYRASTGAWYVYPSSGAAPYGVGWGGSPTDLPVTANSALNY